MCIRHLATAIGNSHDPFPFYINIMSDDGDSTNHNACLVLEVNSAQTCNIYYRNKWDEPVSKVTPLSGSEGINDFETGTNLYARAGGILLVGDQLYIIVAQYNANNTVYLFSTEVF